MFLSTFSLALTIMVLVSHLPHFNPDGYLRVHLSSPLLIDFQVVPIFCCFKQCYHEYICPHLLVNIYFISGILMLYYMYTNFIRYCSLKELHTLNWIQVLATQVHIFTLDLGQSGCHFSCAVPSVLEPGGSYPLHPCHGPEAPLQA